jgi:hypothetical protein
MNCTKYVRTKSKGENEDTWLFQEVQNSGTISTPPLGDAMHACTQVHQHCLLMT